MDHVDHKAARESQWREAPQKPIATKPMTMAEIEHYRKLLVQSYQCDDRDIRFAFIKIANDDGGEDRDDCIWLQYLMKTIDHNNNVIDRPIHNMKLPIPDQVRKQAEKLRREWASSGGGRRRARSALPPPTSSGTHPVQTPPVSSNTQIPRTRPLPRGQRIP